MSELTYEEWRRTAEVDDERTGANRWKATEASNAYDYRVIRARLDELIEVRRANDSRRLLYFFDEGVHGNMSGMGSPALYRKAALGTKDLITRYIGELAAGLEQLADVDDLSREEKITFFSRTERAFGACSLMLSGAGSLGPFHLGVVRALVSQDLLPRVISGSSAGAIVAAIACTHDDAELAILLGDDALVTSFDTVGRSTGGSRRPIDSEYLRVLIDSGIPDMTFGEALAHSGRTLNVSVAPSALHQQSRALNAITSPNVLIREAVMASCAVPGVLPPVTLAARSPDGSRLPYARWRTWVDGSLTDDTPAQRLARIYGCNYFITSQTNPIVLWALQDQNHPLGRLCSIYQASAKAWFRASYPFAMRSVQNMYPLNLMTRMWYSMMTQDYTVDVNITPKRRFSDPTTLLSRVDSTEALSLVREGAAATWPTIERIRNATAIGRRLASILARLESDDERRVRMATRGEQADDPTL